MSAAGPSIPPCEVGTQALAPVISMKCTCRLGTTACEAGLCLCVCVCVRVCVCVCVHVSACGQEPSI